MKDKCTLTNETLCNKCEKIVSNLCETGGKSWTLSVPVDFNNDPDILFSELNKRFKYLQRENEALKKEVERLKSKLDEEDILP